ncbi:hypothetical protein ACFORJ_01610 [Corynebacterium hansenii]|uniref:Uncharacterized protein n=1 Tax=Corynebacterium hansenii TaxID=394964 RepID=A0ABV7ZNZ0_9CORY|nr:hypothetical protein [Corynebacterium hansenii]WJY99304.1 hypothetical protein CHAN_03380 [Corynebacterium hansenii]
MTMTPDHARELINWRNDEDHPKVRDGKGHAMFEVESGGDEAKYWNQIADAPYEDVVLYAAAPDMAEFIAGMREEWGAERRVRGRWHRVVFAFNTIWTDDRAVAEDAADECRNLGLPTRVVRRYVTTPEEA